MGVEHPLPGIYKPAWAFITGISTASCLYSFTNLMAAEPSTEREWYAIKLLGVKVRFHARAFKAKWATARGREVDEIPEFFFGDGVG